MVTDPTITRQPDGRITVEFPDPPRPFYDFAHELVEQYVADLNELEQLRRWKAEALMVLEEWDRVFYAVADDTPARLGASKPRHVLGWVEGRCYARGGVIRREDATVVGER